MFYANSYLEYTFNTHKPLLFSDAIMKYKCDLCDVPISNEYFWQQHLAGKKHQQLTEQRAKLEAMARRSIYLNNFKHPINADELTREMSQFGEVERILTDKSEKNGFAIVEFKEEDAAQNLLHSIHRLKIGKVLLFKLFLQILIEHGANSATPRGFWPYSRSNPIASFIRAPQSNYWRKNT